MTSIKIINYKIILAFSLFAVLSCKKQVNKESETTEESASQVVEETTKKVLEKNKTYAEISIKENGKWTGNKYEGGDFKNVSQLRVPDNHTDHSYYIRYEGPGWESNKIGYRLYLDWRNAIDIFGKLTDTLVLSKVGQDGFDSYHEKDDWGMDILKVGKSLGIGSVGRFVNDSVIHFKEVDSTLISIKNTSEESALEINYHGWKTANDKMNLKSVLSIKPNKRYTQYTLHPSDSLAGICTGIVKFENIDLIQDEKDNAWGYIATYGQQTLVPDNLGMAIFYKKSEVSSHVNSKFDHLLIFKPTRQEITYYFLGAWEQEKNGIKSEEDFKSYLDDKLIELNENNKL